uniref:Transformer n=1 Tax=Knipowitschia caucasica TaxID=637954 RepID=A0AAV2JCU9_KNICA
MVRPHFDAPRIKPRPYRDDNGAGSSSDSNYRSRRDSHDFHGKPPPHWKDSRGRGRPSMTKRSPSMGEPRESRYNSWRPSNEDSYHSYPAKTEPHHQRRQSPSRSNRSPHGPHRSRSPGHRGPPFHSHPPHGHRSPSPRHFHSHPEERRPGPPPPFRGSFRGKRHPAFSHQEQRSRGPPPNYSPRERPYEPPHMKRWNGAGAFSHSFRDKSPREFHGRGPERWAEQDPRRQRGPMERQHSRSNSRERAQASHSHPPPFRPPSWKGASPHSPSRERHMPVQRKRRISEDHQHPSEHGMMHNDQKHPRRERPQLMNIPRPPGLRPFGPRPFGPRPFVPRPFGARPFVPRPFGARPFVPRPFGTRPFGTRPFVPRPFGTRPFGARPFGTRPFGARPLSLRDRSFLIKSKQMRAESLMKLKLPPAFRTRTNVSSVLALRKKRFESGSAPLRKPVQRETSRKQSPTKAESNSSQSSSDSKEQVESRRSVNPHRSSPPKDDLVVLSHWESEAGSSKDFSPSRDHNPKTDRSSGADRASTRRFNKPHFTRSFDDRNRVHQHSRPDKPEGFRRPFTAGRGRPGPPMDRFQKPAFRKTEVRISDGEPLWSLDS